MPDQGAQEKTEQPTPKRKEDARKKGEVAKSMEVNTAFMLLAGVMMMLYTGPAIFGTFEDISTEVFGNISTYEINVDTLPGLVWGGTLQVFKAIFPFLAVMFVMGLAVNFGQVGIRVSEEAFKPNWGKMNPLKGMKELVTRAPFELLKNLFKMILVGTVGYFVLAGHLEEFFHLGDMGIHALLSYLGSVGFELGSKVAIAVMFLAAVDYAYQKYRHTKQLKMSKQEVKEEHKQTEGDPLVKSRIRNLQQEMARNRMMQDVPEADVVITNPTHYAIAIKYNPDEMEAPRVLAKGMRKIAERIKEIAKEHDIPIIENKPLARSLFDLVEIGQEIPAKFYQAIAEILARIYRMKQTG
ncbi:MAG: flagellar biosynthesis protein FlhB [Candidatus Marinimicrobia bacterium]|nr:flagellar biosynthesis protein FlhB [Candidatus Neomarinimicrobiota bacterium]MCF7880516.1 flagellar biosynthesis protein FlhB [Candidatus Neomarinimicrobiota bacterium]